MIHTLKKGALIPPDGRIVFSVPVDMEWIVVAIHDRAGNILRRIPIERSDNLRAGVTRILWDNKYIGWKGTGKGQWFTADPARGNYYYYVYGEAVTDVKATPPDIELHQLPDQVVQPTDTEALVQQVERQIVETGGMPSWIWIAIIAIGLYLLMKGGE